MDTTSSMGGDIAGVRAGAEQILSIVLKDKSRFQKLILSPFNDPSMFQINASNVSVRTAPIPAPFYSDLLSRISPKLL